MTTTSESEINQEGHLHTFVSELGALIPLAALAVFPSGSESCPREGASTRLRFGLPNQSLDKKFGF